METELPDRFEQPDNTIGIRLSGLPFGRGNHYDGRKRDFHAVHELVGVVHHNDTIIYDHTDQHDKAQLYLCVFRHDGNDE